METKRKRPFEYFNVRVAEAILNNMRPSIEKDKTALIYLLHKGLPTNERLSAFLTKRVEQIDRSVWRNFPRKYQQYIQSKFGNDAFHSTQFVRPEELNETALKINYSFAIQEVCATSFADCLPTQQLVEAIAEYNLPILEIAAGFGFLGGFIRPRVPEYIATDDHSQEHTYTFGDVHQMDGREAFDIYRSRFQQLAVLMSYPPTQLNAPKLEDLPQLGVVNIRKPVYPGHSPDSVRMPAAVAQKMLAGDILFYIGKYRGHDQEGSVLTASPEFHDSLDAEFECVRTIPLYRWMYGAQPDLMIYRKLTGPING